MVLFELVLTTKKEQEVTYAEDFMTCYSQVKMGLLLNDIYLWYKPK